MAERIFELPVYWTMSDIMKIRAETLDDAIQQANEAPLPDGSYVSDSFSVAVGEMKNLEGEPAEDTDIQEAQTE